MECVYLIFAACFTLKKKKKKKKKQKTLRSFDMPVPVDQSVQSNMPADFNLQEHYCETLNIADTAWLSCSEDF